MSSEYFVKLDRFEGPLDLLLHLIRVHEIDIFAIDILKLATEYLNYLRLVRYSDLAEAGEFIAMGAQLIEIKSRSSFFKVFVTAGRNLRKCNVSFARFRKLGRCNK